MRLAALTVVLVALAGCGSSAIEGTLEWAQPASVSSHSLSGHVRNTTSHSVTVDPSSIRLLDDRGRKLPGRIHVAGVAGSTSLAAGASVRLTASWKSGKPVRIDYGSGTLALPSA
jgi:hypothetical protein